MKKVVKNIVLISLITTIINIGILGSYFIPIIANDAGNIAFEKMQETREFTDDTNGYAFMIYGATGIFTGLAIVMLGIYAVFLAIVILLPFILYFISWFIQRKKDTKGRKKASIVLTTIAISISAIGLLFFIPKGYFYQISIFSINLVSMIIIITYLFHSRKNILLKDQKVDK